MKVRVYKEEKHIGWFSLRLNPLPEYIDYGGGNLYNLRPAGGLIQNPCYVYVGRPTYVGMLYTQISETEKI